MRRFDFRGIRPKTLLLLFSSAVRISATGLILTLKREIPARFSKGYYPEGIFSAALETLSKRQLEELLFQLWEEKDVLSRGLDGATLAQRDIATERLVSIEDEIAAVNQARKKFISP